MHWRDVEAKLCEQVDGVVRHLLPNGKRDGHEWLVANVSGKGGHSMGINLAGKVGVWRDFNGDEGGKTLISLWRAVRHLEFGPAMGEAKKFLNIDDTYNDRIRSYATEQGAGPAVRPATEDSSYKAVADVWSKCHALTEGGPVWNYLVGQRKLDPMVLDWYGVREMTSHNQWVVVYPYYLPAVAGAGQDVLAALQPQRDVPAWLKLEALERVDGKKKEWTSRGPEKCLWGMRVSDNVAFKKCDKVLICEGEKDAVSWATLGAAQWGYVPVSVPFGAKWRGTVPGQPSPNREWLDRCTLWLEEFESVVVATDMDEAGQRASADIIFEIGPRRCRLVELPLKPKTESTTE